MDAVVVVFETQQTLSINWIGNAMNDTIAEAVLTIILAAENSRASLPGNFLQNQFNIIALDMIAPHAAVVRQDKLSRVLLFLREQFGDSITEAEDGVEIRVDNVESHMAKLDFETMEVEGKWEPLVSRVKYIVKRALGVVAPLGVGGVVEDEDLVAEMEGLVDDGIGHENRNGIGKIEDEDE
jgi:cleavage and polyadenylation specificity factor subunit 3